MKNKSRIGMICILILLVLSGCASVSETEKDLKIGAGISENQTDSSKIVIGATLASEETVYLNTLSKYMKDAAKEKNVELELSYANWDSEVQTEQMETFINQKVDAIILCPVNAKSMLNSLKAAKKAGIPVINMNMKVDTVSTEYIDTYVGASMSEEAALAAELVIQILGETGGKVAIIEGAPGSDPQIYRTQTFVEQLTSHPEIEIVGLSNGKWDREQSYLAAMDLITKNPGLNVIYAHDSNMALGAVRVVKEMGYEHQISIIGIGEDEEYLKAVSDGEIYGLITQPAEYEGKYSVYCAVMAAKGEQLRPWYKDPIEIITKENVKSYRSPMK